LRPGPTARAAAVLVVFLAIFVGLDRLSARRVEPTSVAGGSAPTTAPRGSTPGTAPPSTRRQPTTTGPTTTGSTATTAPAATGSTLRPADGVTVQVLNAVFVTGLGRRVAGMIGDAGYDVVASNLALGTYNVSRIYYTDGHQADARAFQQRFPAFEKILPASDAKAHLSREVALSVVIGDNYRDIRPAT
jgi:LytR cell envelope-related transcriptional attenuator